MFHYVENLWFVSGHVAFDMDAIICVRWHLSYKMLEMEATVCDISTSDSWKRENIFLWSYALPLHMTIIHDSLR